MNFVSLHRVWILLLVAAVLLPAGAAEAGVRRITDALGRTVDVPETVRHVIASGSGCLRLLTYLQAQDRIVGVDDIEVRRREFDARPYALANPQFKDMPVFGEFRGFDRPEQILTLDPLPQVIFKVHNAGLGTDPEELQAKTGIPVVVLEYGNLGGKRPQLYAALRLMAEVLADPAVQARAEAVATFFETRIADLQTRVRDIPEAARPSVFVGGIASRGPHGFQSTEPGYPPFAFVNARNLAGGGTEPGKEKGVVEMAKEQIVTWNPDVLFLDLATLQLGESAGGLHELKADPAYQTLTAVQQGRVYGVLPYNWYSQNFGSILANAYFIGALLYPDRFAGVDPVQEADGIYTFLVGKPVFGEMNALFGKLAFTRIPLQ